MLELYLGDEAEVVDGNDAVEPDDHGSAPGRNVLESAVLKTMPDPAAIFTLNRTVAQNFEVYRVGIHSQNIFVPDLKNFLSIKL
jgi:hypothetical protein